MKQQTIAEGETLQRVQTALFHLRKGLAPFVEARMTGRYGAKWHHSASRAHGGFSNSGLDEYGLLKTVIDKWRDVFDGAFALSEKRRVRSFISIAMDARNAAYHASSPLQDDDALRYLDAIHQLLKSTKAADIEIDAVRELYEKQRHSPAAMPGAGATAPAAPAIVTAPSIRRGPKQGTIDARVLEYIRAHPGLNDDKISERLNIRPRQTVNQAARGLARAGLIERVKKSQEKILNYPTGAHFS